jgi:hypothetical protein
MVNDYASIESKMIDIDTGIGAGDVQWNDIEFSFEYLWRTVMKKGPDMDIPISDRRQEDPRGRCLGKRWQTIVCTSEAMTNHKTRHTSPHYWKYGRDEGDQLGMIVFLEGNTTMCDRAMEHTSRQT